MSRGSSAAGQNATEIRKMFLNYCGLLTINFEFCAKIANFEATFGAKKARSDGLAKILAYLESVNGMHSIGTYQMLRTRCHKLKLLLFQSFLLLFVTRSKTLSLAKQTNNE